jgi:hypothetical protein
MMRSEVISEFARSQQPVILLFLLLGRGYVLARISRIEVLSLSWRG